MMFLPTQKSKRVFFAILVFAFLFTSGQGCFRSGNKNAPAPVSLTVWTVFDDNDGYNEAFRAYQTEHPHVSFVFKKLRFEEYEQRLLEAFASGRGPDIFLVHNAWMNKYKDLSLIAPMPKTLDIVVQETTGGLKKEVIFTEKKVPTLTEKDLRDQYVGTVADRVLMDYKQSAEAQKEELIFGVPMSLDTLALYYNSDLLDQAGIAEPAKTWDKFQEDVKLLTKVNENGDIIQSGAAIGTAKNVERSADILSVLMMQTGTPMVNDRGEATFDKFPQGAQTTGETPGADAVRFYADFSDPTKDVYTWNSEQPNSFDAFVTGKTAYFFGYAYHLPLIRARAPKLNFGVSELPQIANAKQVNYANYWIHTVSPQTTNSNWAWDFILFMQKKENAVAYLQKTEKPTARRDLIESQIEDIYLGPFANQILTADDWYEGKDINAAEESLKELIDLVVSGSMEIKDALDFAVKKVNQTL
ncbi:MAG: hypothetical protein ACD_76C00066G0004 [uncultured bacterium]|nr:MAG: hypothetical protein ACD_76C00066G0004 [uncultured bacterium]HBD05738.1 hypothetical protein [Candidatus Uhrbacteria bacterium]